MFINRKHGFTLLEMMLALGVFTLIVGTLLFTMKSIFHLCTEVAELRQWSQKTSTLHEFLQSAFRTLPPDASMEYAMDEKENSLQPIFKLSKIADIYHGEYSTNSMQFFIKKQTDERFDLMISRGTNSSFPILRKIESLQWQFYNPQNQTWETNWQNPTALPSLLELSFKTMDAPTPITMTFWIPNAQLSK